MRSKGSNQFFITKGYQNIERHLQWFFAICFIINVIELRHSAIDFASKKNNAVIFGMDCLAFPISLLQFLLEFATVRTSRYGDDDCATCPTAIANEKRIQNPSSPTLNASILSMFFFSYYNYFVFK